MTQILHCPLCGSDNVQSGMLQCESAVRFRPDNAKFLRSDAANVKLKGLLCTQCGNVTLLGDTEQIAKLAPDSLVT